MEKDFVESRSEVQALTKQKIEALGKFLKVEAFNADREKQLALHEAEIKCVKEEHEVEINNIRQDFVEAAVNLEVA